MVKELYQETNLMDRKTLTLEQISSLNYILKEKFNHSIDDEIDNDTAKIVKNNPAGRFFHYESNRHFGKLAPYTGY